MTVSTTLGKFIRHRRLERGLTQEQLAEAIGESVNQSDISRLERDQITLPRRERLEQLAAALDVSLGDLLARTGWLTAGDELDRHLDQAPNGHTDSAPTVPPTPAEVRDLIQTVASTRTLIASALEALASADAALDTAVHALQGPGERGKVQPPAGVIRRWETAQVFLA